MNNLLRRFGNLLMMEEDGGAGGSGGTGNGDGNGNKDKIFTQEELNSIIASEKQKNQAAVYKHLGFESAEDAKAFIDKYKEEEDKKKDDLTKANEQAEALRKEKEAEAKKAKKLEYKFEAMKEGCDAKNADDVVTLVMNKMSDDKDFATALKEVKETYPTMFDSSNSDGNGTGTGGNPPRGKGGKDISGIGKRLAEQRKTNSASKENNYFQR